MSKSSKRSSRILFVGNSFTARNDLPDLIAQLASARGVKIEQALLSIGGASLRTHWNKGEAQTAIERGKFDYVVLQEQSTLPIKNAARMRENVLLFDEAAFTEMDAVRLAEPNYQHIAKVDGHDEEAAYRAACMLAESVGIELEDG